MQDLIQCNITPQLLDIGVIDVETCKPLPNVLVDIWQANSTGFYAGISYFIALSLLVLNPIPKVTLFLARTSFMNSPKSGVNVLA